MKENMTILTVLTISIMLIAANGYADIPAPPVNQSLGMPDGIFNDLTEADCRACHDQPGPDNSTSSSDRHHLQYGTPIIYGDCSVSGNTCLTDADCDSTICETYGNACSDDADCYVTNRETCGEVCVGKTAASDPLVNTEIYECLSCHEEVTIDNETSFLVQPNCLYECHTQLPGEGSVHHFTATAQGTDSPLGDPLRGDCTPCHGSLVDDYGDEAIRPTYDPLVQIPSVRNGTAEQVNSVGNKAGACNYCHVTGTGTSAPGTDEASGVFVYSNTTTHHTSGVYRSRTGAINANNCTLCHGDSHLVLNIRTCEQCHGYESLHNIQADSDGDDIIELGEELDGYGHVGTGVIVEGSDCWGCHGFETGSASAPGAGPITPFLSDSTENIIIAGKDKTILLSGSSLSNSVGETMFESIFRLTSKDGAVSEITPFYITASKAFITIPGTTTPGNYLLTAVKDGGAVISNPLSISIKPPTGILISAMEIDCGAYSDKLEIYGYGFGDSPPAGSEEFLNVQQNGVNLTIVKWTDTHIVATGATFGAETTVNGFFGSATK